MKVFCYGSNMSSKRIIERCPNSQFIGVAKVSGYRLVFNKKGKDGSGKANLVYTGEDNLVWGVIWDITDSDKILLDKAEGLNKGYNECKLGVVCRGQEVDVYCYIGDERYLESGLVPYGWYLDFCLEGAKEHNLPKEYIMTLEGVRVDTKNE